MPRQPRIKTSLPGPKAQRFIDLDQRYVSPSYTRYYPLVAETGRGVWLRDPDGNIFLDFTAGIAVTSSGHCHPKVVRAIKRQAKKLLHMSGTDFYYEPQIKLAERLAKLAPGESEKKVFFCNSGTESVEAAFKLARYKTKREKMISFFGAFHGRTLGALSLTGSRIKQRENFGGLIPGVTHVGYGYCYRCPYHLDYPACNISCVSYIEETLFHTTLPPEEVAAVIVEPIQGEGGIVDPPPEYFPMLRQLTQKYNILLIADEVQTGMGRTGKMFAIEHWGVEPDIICVAKGIASGLPLGAIIAPSNIMIWEPGSHASTFGGNPVACSAALATLDLLEDGLVANARILGDYFKERLLKLKARYPLIGDVRGKGLLLGIELVKDRATKERATDLRNELIQRCFQKGLLILGCGESTIRFTPPLVINRAEVDVGLKIFEECLRESQK